MSSKLRVVIDYDKGDHFFNDSSNDYPFTNRANLKELCSFYQLELLKIELFCNVNLDWQGLFFHKKIDGKGREYQVSYLVHNQITSFYSLSSPKEWIAELYAACVFQKFYPSSLNMAESIRFELLMGFNPSAIPKGKCQ